ncbi:MAG: hypothetical protein LUQ22_04470 [Methanotrichaceae archaeon]|nr:hypothetical protein [Methanotrichaceae archaeon]
MRNILAITMALMIVAVLIMPTMGYTIQTPGNQSYTFVSSPRINYTIGSGIAAHNLTQSMVAALRTSIPPAVTITRILPRPAVNVTHVAPSIHVVATRGPWTSPAGVEQIGQPAAVEQIGQPAAVEKITQPAAVEQIGQPAAVEKIGAVVEQPPAVAVPANVTAPVMFSIMGSVFDDQDGNGVKDLNESGLAGWTVDLMKPDNTKINTSTKDDGSYAFMDLSVGEYVISEVKQSNWDLIAPTDNMIKVNLTENKIDQNFANKMVVAPVPAPVPVPANVTAPENATVTAPENATFPENVDITAPGNATFPANV